MLSLSLCWWQKTFLVSSRRPQFPSSSICLHNWVSLSISDAGFCSRYPSFVSSLLLFFVSYLPASVVPICCMFLFLYFFLILASFGFTPVSHSFRRPRLYALWPFAVHVHFHSLSFISSLVLFLVTLPFFCLAFSFLPFSPHRGSRALLTPLSACRDENPKMPARERERGRGRRG